MTVREVFHFRASTGDDIYIKAYETIWEGVLFEVDRQGITLKIDNNFDWISYDDLEVWEELNELLIKLNGKEVIK